MFSWFFENFPMFIRKCVQTNLERVKPMRLWPVCILLECTVVILFYYLSNMGRVGIGWLCWQFASHLHRGWLWQGSLLHRQQKWSFTTIYFHLCHRSIRWGVQIGTHMWFSRCASHFYLCDDKTAFLLVVFYSFLSPLWCSMQYLLQNKVSLWTLILIFCLDRCPVHNGYWKVLWN